VVKEIVLNRELVEKYMEETDRSIPELADEMGIDRTYLYKILRKGRKPGRKFIEGAVRVLPYSYENIFLTKVVHKNNKSGD